MAVQLQKGQNVALTKEYPELTKMTVGLGWDPVNRSGGKHIFGSLFSGGNQAPNFDCDASVLLLSENEKLTSEKNVVYFGHLTSDDGSVEHSGDNLTGVGDGDDEQIYIDLTKLPEEINKMVFVVNIYDCVKRKQHFGMIKNAYIRIINPQTREELIRYNLSDDYSGATALIAGEMYRAGSQWTFAAVGRGTSATSLNDIVRSYT